eukprot:1322756-Amorphochlora_amoeboformis.AAC.2
MRIHAREAVLSTRVNIWGDWRGPFPTEKRPLDAWFLAPGQKGRGGERLRGEGVVKVVGGHAKG